MSASGFHISLRPSWPAWLPAFVLVLAVACGGDDDADSPAASQGANPARDATPAPRAAGPVYFNRVWGWTVSYPQGWVVNSADPATVSVTPPAELPRALIVINSGQRPPSLGRAQLFTALVNSYEQSLEASGISFIQVNRRQFTLSDYPAAEAVYDLLAEDQPGRARLIIVSDNTGLFTINIETHRDDFATLEPFFNQVVDSFDIR
jgi:hypothetical protein